MKKELAMLQVLHTTCNFHWEGKPTKDIPQNIKDIRAALMQEELQEVIEAMESGSIEELSKELCDLLYTIFGTIGAFGLQDKIEDVFAEVHRSNMSKLGSDGKPICSPEGKMMKSEHYREADVAQFFTDPSN